MARRRGRSYSPRRWFKRRKSGPKTIPIIPTMAGIAPIFKAFSDSGGAEGIMSNPQAFAINTVYEYTGYDSTNRTFNFNKLLGNALMWGAAYGAHLILNRVGVNKAIKRVPVVGRYISL